MRNPLERLRFRNSVPITALKVALGVWTPTATSPRPSMQTLHKAEFWWEEQWRALRESFRTPRTTPPLAFDDRAELAQVTVGEGEALRTVLAYKATTATPNAKVNELPVGMAVLEARPDTRSGRPRNRGLWCDGLHLSYFANAQSF